MTVIAFLFHFCHGAHGVPFAVFFYSLFFVARILYVVFVLALGIFANIIFV